MPASQDKIIQLRQLLVERFGHADFGAGKTFETGLPALDEIGIPQGALTEIVSSPTAGPGGGLLLYGILHAGRAKGTRTILIDGKRAFSPKGLPQADLDQMLWLRCRDAGQALKVADLTVRDGNVPLVVLMLTLNPAGELRRIPATAWQRLQMLAEKSAVTLLAFTPQAQIGCARLRLSVGGAFPLEKLQQDRRQTLSALRVRVERRRVGAQRENDEDLCRAAGA